jgi:hypothetical protein
LAVCAVPAIRDALNARRTGRIYICNLATQDAETKGLHADAHLAALVAHDVVVDTVICDPATEVGALSAGSSAHVVTAALAAPNGHSHDPAALAEVLVALAPVRVSGQG